MSEDNLYWCEMCERATDHKHIGYREHVHQYGPRRIHVQPLKLMACPECFDVQFFPLWDEFYWLLDDGEDFGDGGL